MRGRLFAAGLILLLGSAGLFLVRYRIYAVPTTSMAPLITPGDRIVVDTWARDVAVGEVVLAGSLVKRVAAGGGAVIECCDASGRLTIDGTPSSPGVTPFSGRVPDGHLFLLGDNEAVSEDSRIIGAVPVGQIRGTVVAVVRSPTDAATLPGHAVPLTVPAAVAGLVLLSLSGLLRAATALRSRDPDR